MLLIYGFFYAGLVALLFWQVHDRYIEFTGTLQTHLLNLALIVAVTGLVILATFDLFGTVVNLAPGGGRPMRYAMRVIGLYVVVPCGVFVARYGTVDMGGYERVRWPTTIVGWVAVASATTFLLLGQMAL